MRVPLCGYAAGEAGVDFEGLQMVVVRHHGLTASVEYLSEPEMRESGNAAGAQEARVDPLRLTIQTG